VVSLWQVGGVKDEHRNEPFGVLLVFEELWKALGLDAEEALALLSVRLACNNIDRPGSDLDRDMGVRLEVVVPARTGRGSAVRRDHDISSAIAQVGERVDAAPAGFRSGVMLRASVNSPAQ